MSPESKIEDCGEFLNQMSGMKYSNRSKVFQHHQISMYRLCHLSTKESVGTKMGI